MWPGIPLQCALKHSTFLLQFESFYDTSIISNTCAEQIEHILLVELFLHLTYWFIYLQTLWLKELIK